jgi:predicted phosphoribosyltransferase
MTGRGAERFPRVFRDREEAGRALAAALHGRVERSNAIVLAIPPVLETMPPVIVAISALLALGIRRRWRQADE